MITHTQQLLRLKKIKPANGINCTILGALRHTKREIKPAENIDPARSKNNITLVGNGTASEVYADVMKLAADRGVDLTNLRKNAVHSIEFVAILPTSCNARNLVFFEDTLEFIKANYAGEIYSAEIHLDEHDPHMHTLLLPITDNGKMMGSDIAGSPRKMAMIQRKFREQVLEKHGVIEPSESITKFEYGAIRKYLEKVKRHKPDTFEKLLKMATS